jgi:hypothetical protein
MVLRDLTAHGGTMQKLFGGLREHCAGSNFGWTRRRDFRCITA